MKFIKAFIIVFILTFTSFSNAVNLNSGKGLACEAILCAVGIAIPASHSKCRQVLTDWSLYLASHPWDSAPRCPRTDAQSNIVGYSEMKCETIQDDFAQQQCFAATGRYNNCRPDDEACKCPTHDKNGQKLPLCQIQ